MPRFNVVYTRVTGECYAIRVYAEYELAALQRVEKIIDPDEPCAAWELITTDIATEGSETHLFEAAGDVALVRGA